MRLATALRTAAAALLAAAGIVFAAGSASAAPVISITDNHGVLTTGSYVYPEEQLTEFGYGTGSFTITSVAPAGHGLTRVTLNAAPDNDTVPRQSSLVFDFAA